MKIPCSSCNQRLEIPEELAGQTIDCPACNATLAVPAMAAPTPAPAQVQESAPQAASSKKSKPPIPKWVIAAVAGVVIVVLMLVIFNGSKPKAQDISIHNAVGTRDIEAVKKHLAAGTDVNAKISNFGTPLLFAAEIGHKEIAELLITKGADVNAKDGYGSTPLHAAAYEDHKEICRS